MPSMYKKTLYKKKTKTKKETYLKKQKQKKKRCKGCSVSGVKYFVNSDSTNGPAIFRAGGNAFGSGTGDGRYVASEQGSR